MLVINEKYGRVIKSHGHELIVGIDCDCGSDTWVVDCLSISQFDKYVVSCTECQDLAYIPSDLIKRG